MKFFRYSILFCLILFSFQLYSQNYELVWSDEFNGSSLDLSSWTRETGGNGWGNSELQYYTNREDNSYLQDGKLIIKAMQENYGGRSYTSARLKTQGKRTWQYGKIEARIKLPFGQGIWPAFWMLGQTISTVGWPACGEIDIMEMIGGDGRENTVHGTAHWDNNGQHASYGGNFTLSSGTFADDFHIFTIEWDETSIKWYMDGANYHTMSIIPSGLSEFHQEFFIILNLAVGGNWPGIPNSTTVFPQYLEIDYVRVYQKNVEVEGFLKASEKVIVNSSSGNEVYLRGIGLGGWLVPEGYMLHTSGFANSPTQIKNKIEELIGKENSDDFFRLYRENYVNKKDIEQIAAWGFNSIRLPFHYEFFTPKDQPGVFIEDGFNIVDSILNWCKEYKLYLVLDLHCAPGAQNRDNISDSDGEARLWTDTLNQTRTIELWKKIAEKYADEKWIGGYDLINETAVDLGPTNEPLRNLYLEITNAIREVDTNHIIFIEGNWYATDFTGLTPPWDDNMVYSFHKYWNETNIGTINYLLNIRNTHNIPLWLGETGENSNAWFTECVELMNSNNIGWAWWPHKKISSIAGPLSSPLTPDYQTLLDYWNGNATKPSVEFAKNALFNQAKSLNIDSCKFQKDVIDALFRQPYDDQLFPFAEHIIPGRIYAVDYDLGKEGIAYSDEDYKNINGPGGTAYNSGYAYRNDGVDIEKCSDTETNGYNVGWIGTDEWLNYTVNISSAGTYNIKFRIAGQNSGGIILLRLNNELIGYINVPATGGWQNWQSVTIEDVDLTSGKKTLQVQFFSGGFNLNYIEFEQIITSLDENKSDPKSFELSQNYPNPFNPSTTINFFIPEDSFVTLKIYDSKGSEIKTLLNQQMQSGSYNVLFNAEGISSQVLFYRLYANTGNQNHNFTTTKKMILLK